MLIANILFTLLPLASLFAAGLIITRTLWSAPRAVAPVRVQRRRRIAPRA